MLVSAVVESVERRVCASGLISRGCRRMAAVSVLCALTLTAAKRKKKKIGVRKEEREREREKVVEKGY